VEDVELALGEMCNVVKNTYGGDKGGFIGGQVYKFSGFVSEEGSLNGVKQADDHLAIVTYWNSFEEHEKSHADHTFKEKFDAVAKLCTRARSLVTTCFGRAFRSKKCSQPEVYLMSEAALLRSE